MQKEFIYAPIPEFDQVTQYVKQSTPVDMGDFWFVGFEVRGSEPSNSEGINDAINI